MKKIPHIERENGLSTLYVDGEPYLALAGEIHNSSSSSLSYMKDKVWPKLRDLNLNTVIAPVYWELLESEEGKFDFELVDGLINQARDENVRLVLLWFGLWKNGESKYVPGWVKKNFGKYFRERYPNGEMSETISPLCGDAVKADANAFGKLMKHLKETDSDKNTVIMIQVENEIGFLGSDRDYSEKADTEFDKDVPEEVEKAFGRKGKWKEAFKEDAGEYFMAYHYAKAVQEIVQTGSNEYPLPMYVNAWLEQFPKRAGSYPSGGPVAKVMKMWMTAAPAVKAYAPDIYVPNFADVCAEYTKYDNPLFIPEARRDPVSAANVFYAVGKHNALCFSPFGIEDFTVNQYPTDVDLSNAGLLNALNIDDSAFSTNNAGYYLSKSYRLLGNMSKIINKYRGTGKMKGFLQNNDYGCILSFTQYDLKITYHKKEKGRPVSGGLIIEISENEFILAGIGFTVEFLPKRGETTKVSYVRIEEGTFEKDTWVKGRRLNGDEAWSIGIGTDPSALSIEVYKY